MFGVSCLYDAHLPSAVLRVCLTLVSFKLWLTPSTSSTVQSLKLHRFAMSSRKSIVFDDDEHPLAPVVLRIMQCVYRQFHPSRVPVEIDHWWFSASLSYQVDGETQQPKIILNLREGESDYPAMDTHF